MEGGQTKNLTDPFVARRSLIHKSVAKDVQRVMDRFKMVSISISSAPAQSSGYSFWKKNEPEFVNLLDDDSLNPDDVVNCPICREEFKTFSKKRKEKCLICGRIVCSTCHNHVLPVKGAADGVDRELKMCTTCYTTIAKEQKRLQLKNYFASSANSGFTTFYEEMFFLASVVQRDLPKLKYLLESPLTASSLKKAKELDVSLGKTLSDFEREIKNLEHFQVNTKKQQQLRDAVKMGFITSLSGTGPEYKLLHRQLETAASQPLAPDNPEAVTSNAITKALTTAHHSRSRSATHIPTPAQVTPAPTMTPVLSSKKDKRRTLLGNRLSSFTSLFSNDSKSTNNTNTENGPYISGINPVLSRMSGGERITILGERFHPKCGVIIGNADCPVIERGQGSLVVLSPSQTDIEPQDVCVYNPNGDRCVMPEMLFYADDKMFVQETPTIPEDNVLTITPMPIVNPDRTNYSTQPNGTPTVGSVKRRSFGKQDSYSSDSAGTPSRNGTTPPKTNPSPSSSFSKNTPSFVTTPSFGTTPSSFGTTPSSFGTTPSFGKIQTSPTKIIEDYESRDEGEISLVMIKPVMSPLQGTRVTMELSRPLPQSFSIRIGGKIIQALVSEDNPREISFISPPQPAGFKSIEISLPSGKSVVLENILQYDNFIPQMDYSNVTQRATPPTSGRVWGKRA